MSLEFTIITICLKWETETHQKIGEKRLIMEATEHCIYNENFYLMHTNNVTYADRVKQEG